VLTLSSLARFVAGEEETMSAVALAYSYEAVPQSSFSDRVSQLLDKIDFRLIVSDEDREAIARLRYDAYLREGAISPNPTKMFADLYDDKNNVWIFGLYIGGELASSIRIHVATKDNPVFPSLSVFSDLLEPELAAGNTIVDPTRFVTNPRLSRLHPGLPYVTLRLCWLAAEQFEAEHFLVAVRAEHQAYYKRVFRHRSICGPRTYPLLSKPITLMTVNYRDVAEQVHRRYPFFRSTFFERRMLFERYQSVPPTAIPLRPALSANSPSQVASLAG
jgi:N-acyl amino acid synthase FeeM